MAFEMFGRKITKVGIVGSGQIGPDIALHFRQTLASSGVEVAIVDIVQAALDKGKARTAKKIGKDVEKGKVKKEQADALLSGMTWTTDYAALGGADVIVEAATENPDVKHRIFRQIEAQAPAHALLLSNSSHMEPEAIFDEIEDRSRCAVTHYFFPAEKNPAIEVIPGKDTARPTTDFLMRFYEWTGKIPIEVKSRYGYAIDPIFEGLFEAAALCVEAGMGSVKEVDEATRKALRMGVGPFTAHNLTGGNPLTHHGLEKMGSKINAWFKVPRILDEALKAGTVWETVGRDEKLEIPPDKAKAIGDAMTGAYLGIVCEILGSGISSVSDLELGVATALAMEPPFALMNRIGVKAALGLVEAFARAHPGFVVHEALRDQAATGKPWKIPYVTRRDVDGGVAIITVRRPAVLNALNDAVIDQVREAFEALKTDGKVRAAVITGFGKRAFVAGADINELAALPDEAAAVAKSLQGHGTTKAMENLGKPVVAALNGLAFGGGSELAAACNARVAVDTKMLVGQPEPKLGIIPGFGGTQRLPRWVGVRNSWKLLRDGEPISSAQAREIGLVNEIVKGDVLDRAVTLARDMADGKIPTPEIPRDPIEVPGDLPQVDIGHLSRKIDEILVKAILDGARSTLEEGLKIEAKAFGRCLLAEDMRIGMKNFLENGPKAKAQFVHK